VNEELGFMLARGPPGFTTLSYKESALRGILLVA